MLRAERQIVGAFPRRAGLVALLALAADQAVKEAVRGHLATCAASSVPACPHWMLPSSLALIRLEGDGGLPGLLTGPLASMLLPILGLLLVVLYARRLRSQGWTGALALGLQAGGALSNLLDRLIAGMTLDYLPLGGGAFNLADVALMVGMLLAVGVLTRAPAGGVLTPSHPPATAWRSRQGDVLESPFR
jgi:lipoprotein signal peptidase